MSKFLADKSLEGDSIFTVKKKNIVAKELFDGHVSKKRECVMIEISNGTCKVTSNGICMSTHYSK